MRVLWGPTAPPRIACSIPENRALTLLDANPASLTMKSDGAACSGLNDGVPERRSVTLRKISAFRKALEREQDNARRAAARCRQNLAIEQSADTLEAIGYAGVREMALAGLSRQSNLISQIQAALDRLEEGTFGLCQQCGTPIPPKRLEALPWTPLCVGCQESADSESEHALSVPPGRGMPLQLS